MNSVWILLLVSLARAATTVDPNCAQKCPAVVSGAARFCASDLALYSDTCRMSCANADNYLILTCGSLTDSQCSAQCAKQLANIKCQQQAKLADQASSSTPITDIRCGSAGALFASLRVAQCTNANVTELFSCSLLGLSQVNCNTKCSLLPKAQAACASQASSPICAVDSLIYRNQCEVTFMATQVAVGFTSKEVASSQACQDYVLLKYGLITGIPPKPHKGSAIA